MAVMIADSTASFRCQGKPIAESGSVNSYAGLLGRCTQIIYFGAFSVRGPCRSAGLDFVIRLRRISTGCPATAGLR